MKKPRRFFVILLFTAAIAVFTTSICVAAVIRVNGSGSCVDLMVPLFTAYAKSNKGISFQVEKPLGTSGAIKALLADVLDIAVVSRPLKPEESAKGAEYRTYGAMPFAVVTHKNVAVKDISTAQIESIYSGATNVWPDGKRIRIILRPEEDIDTKILGSLSANMLQAIEKARARPGMKTAVTDPEAYEAILKIEGSVGGCGLSSVIVMKLGLNVLSLNGVKPTVDNLANGKYPMAKQIAFVTTRKTSAAALKFLSFVYSENGRAIARKAGAWVPGESK